MAKSGNKGKVREHLAAAQDGYAFTNDSLAVVLDVKPKDVSNLVIGLARSGALERWRRDGKSPYTYTVIANTMALVLAKSNGVDASPEPEALPKVTRKVIKQRARARDPFVIAIDDEIKQLEAKVRRLKQVRREFS